MPDLCIGITGHTSGIGKALSDSLSGQITGFSRSNGFDINRPEDRSRIIQHCRDFDVFINNAKGEGLAQTQLLMEMFECWRDDRKKTIIIIGSLAASNVEFRGRPHIYSIEKVALHKAVRQLQNCRRQCRISELQLGLVNTPANSHITERPMMSAHQVVPLVNQILHSDLEILCLEARFQA